MPDEAVAEQRPTFDSTGRRVRAGGCTCGAVRFEARGDPLKVGTCHCLSCRKATGAVYSAYADWPVDSFSFQGEVRTFDGRSFCPDCGSRLFQLSAVSVEVMLGALDEAPGDLTPTREGWIIRREHWVGPVSGADQYERDPPKAS